MFKSAVKVLRSAYFWASEIYLKDRQSAEISLFSYVVCLKVQKTRCRTNRNIVNSAWSASSVFPHYNRSLTLDHLMNWQCWPRSPGLPKLIAEFLLIGDGLAQAPRNRLCSIAKILTIGDGWFKLSRTANALLPKFYRSPMVGPSSRGPPMLYRRNLTNRRWLAQAPQDRLG